MAVRSAIFILKYLAVKSFYAASGEKNFIVPYREYCRLQIGHLFVC